jgi:hypothetical protein
VLEWLKQHRSGIAALLTGCHKGHSVKLTLQEQFQPECITVEGKTEKNWHQHQNKNNNARQQADRHHIWR